LYFEYDNNRNNFHISIGKEQVMLIPHNEKHVFADKDYDANKSIKENSTVSFKVCIFSFTGSETVHCCFAE
jgi:hypothetical protein